MGGRIGVESRPGDGSTFWFDLQFEVQAHRREALRTLDNARVLLVSGNDGHHQKLLDYLAGWRVETTSVDSASEAFSRIDDMRRLNRDFHVILVNKPLMDIDALQFANALRKKSVLSQTALILAASALDKKTRADLANVGYSCVLDTPVDKTLLFNALHAAPLIESRHEGDVVQLSQHYGQNRKKHRLRILVAEDNPTNQKVIGKILERAGHQAQIVSNGEEALDELETTAYDLVILDMHMPVMGGIQTAKLYRFMYPDNRKLPIVILTANATTEARKECEEAGIDAYLTKPVETKTLLDVIASLADKGTPTTGLAYTSNLEEAAASGDSNAGEQPVLNSAVLKDLESLGYGSDFLIDLIQGFIRDGNLLLNDMQRALDQGDYTAFKDSTHALKGNSGSVGAIHLYKACFNSERLSRTDWQQRGDTLMNDIRQEFARACSALTEYSKQYQKGLG